MLATVTTRHTMCIFLPSDSANHQKDYHPFQKQTPDSSFASSLECSSKYILCLMASDSIHTINLVEY